MKFRSYQTQGQIGPSATGISNFRYSNPGAVAAAKESGNTGVVFAQGVMGVVDRVNTVKAMEANNYYNKRMSEESADLINNHKEGEALNITELYDEAHQKVMDETMSKYGNFIRYGKAGDDFRDYTERDNISRRNNMQKYQMVETEKYEESVFQNQVQQSLMIATTGSYSPEAMQESMGRLESFVHQRNDKYGEERVQQEMRKYKGAFAKAGIDYMIGHGEYDTADAMVKQYEEYLPVELRNAYGKAIFEKQKERSERDIVEQLYAKHGDNIEAALAELDSMGGLNIGGVGDTQAGVMAGFKAFEGQRMPNGRNGCVEGVVRIGSYYSPWLKKHQEQNNVDDLIRAAQSEADGPDVITFDEKSLTPGDVIVYADSKDETQHVVIYAGGTSYVGNSSDQQRIVQGSDYREMDNLHPYQIIKTGGTGTAGTGSSLKPEDRDEIKKRYMAKISEQKTIRRIKIDKMADDYRQQVISMKNSGMGGYSIFETLTQGVTDNDTRDAIKAACNAEGLSIAQPATRGSRGPGGTGNRTSQGAKLGEDGEATLVDYIREGRFNNKAELINNLADMGYGQSALKKADTLWNQYVNNSGVFKYDLTSLANDAVEQFGLTGERKKQIKDGMKSVGYTFVMKYRAEHGGEDPDESDVLEAMINSNSEPVYGGAMYKPESNWFSKEVLQATPAELASKGIKSIAPYPYDDGIVRENEFIVEYYGSKSSEWHTGQEIDEILGR